MNVNQKKIIVHNLTLSGIEVVPGILDFDQRGVVYSNKGDIVITKSPVDGNYLSYLEDLGWNFKGTTFLNPKISNNYTYNSIFYDSKIISSTKNLKDYYVDIYNMTVEEEKFAQKIGKQIYANCKIAEKFGTKSGFRKLAKKLGLPVASGFEKITTLDQLIKSLNELFNKGKDELAIKIDEGVSGAGITRIMAHNYEKHSKKERLEFLKRSLFKLKQAQRTSGVVVEEWLQNVTASPSIQIQVFPNKSWKIVSMHNQILEGKEKWYIGCRFPQTSITKNKLTFILKGIERFTKFLISKGFIGFFGIDLVLTDDKKVYWMEANIRKPATFYPRIIAEKINNGKLNSIQYIATDFTVAKFKGVKFNFLKEKFVELLYPIKSKNEGIIFYNVGALKDAGRFDIVCLARSSKRASDLLISFKKKVHKIIQ